MFEEELPRMQEPESFSSEHTIQLRRSDIDYNGHVHNTRYLDFAMEALPEEYYRQDGCKSFRINYRNPVMLSDHPVLRMKETETGFVVGICGRKIIHDDRNCVRNFWPFMLRRFFYPYAICVGLTTG